MTTTLPKPKHTGESALVRNRKFAGIFVRKECWTLSRLAKLVILVIGIGMAWAGIRFIHPFLAVTNRTNGELLVVEAWVPRYTLTEAVKVYKSGGYGKMIASGCSRPDDLDGRTTLSPAEAAAIQLERFGMDSGSVVAVPCGIEERDRTYNTALAVKEWIRQSGKTVTSIDVVTLGPHARRSRLLFQKAFGDNLKVGVIAIEDRSYDSAHWWKSSEGVRQVIGEGIAYTYVRIFFHPSEKVGQLE